MVAIRRLGCGMLRLDLSDPEHNENESDVCQGWNPICRSVRESSVIGLISWGALSEIRLEELFSVREDTQHRDPDGSTLNG